MPTKGTIRESNSIILEQYITIQELVAFLIFISHIFFLPDMANIRSRQLYYTWRACPSAASALKVPSTAAGPVVIKSNE